jgi:subtilisin family serine protease
VKILLPILALLQISSAPASLVGIMDSGTDVSHKDLAPKAWVNTQEKNGDKDVDGDGLPGDVYGYDFTTNTPNPFDSKYNYLITQDVKNFFLYYSKYELGTISAQEMAALRTLSQNDKVMNDANFIGGYIHGTHVAGISTINVPNAKILPMKIIPTVYQEVVAPVKDETPPTKDEVKPVADTTPLMSIEELRAELVKEANNNIEEMVGIHKVLKFHKVDVVNQSFGIGYVNALDFIKSAFIETQKREPTNDELESLVRTYMNTLVTSGTRMYAAAPDTVFCVAAGNDTNNNDKNPDYPSNIQIENKISVAATQGYSKIADFSNYGEQTVDVAAPGVAITATAPTNSYIPLSGTSQATPFVTNTIAQMKDANPAITPRDIRAIVLQTVDVKTWLKGKVRTSGIVNKVRAIRAALNLKTMSIDQAIAKAKAEVADVTVTKNKSLGLDSVMKMPLGFKFNLKRPSLLIKK